MNPSAASGFDVDKYLEEKVGPSLAWGWDRVKSQLTLATSYGVTEEAGLETVFLSLLDPEDVKVKHLLLHVQLTPSAEAGGQPRSSRRLQGGAAVQGPAAARGPGLHQPGGEDPPVDPAGRLPLRARC